MSDQTAKTPSSAFGSGTVEVTEEGPASWIVRTRIPKANLQSMEITVGRLRDLKALLSKRYDVPVSALEFAEVLENREDRDQIVTAFRIQRVALERGICKVTLRSAVSPETIEFPDMSGLLDVYPLTPEGTEITLEMVLNMIHLSDIAPACIDIVRVHHAVQHTLSTKIPVLGFEIARGKFPQSGSDAQLMCELDANPDPLNLEEYSGRKRVQIGDLLCRKIPPQPSGLAGYNVKGEPVSGLKGLDFQLINGNGALLTAGGTAITASIEGYLVIKSETRVIASFAGSREILVKVEAGVKAIRTYENPGKLSLVTDDAIEIKGNLESGSEIISAGAILIEGNVHTDVKIQSREDVIVTGTVTGSQLISDRNLIIRGSIRDSKISASGQVVVDGEINSTQVNAESIIANKFTGSSLIANQSVKLNTIDPDEDRMVSTIVLGMQGFFNLRVRDNETFIKQGEQNLARLEQFFGEDIIREVQNEQSIQVAFMKYLGKTRSDRSHKPLSSVEMTLHRRLLEAVPPLRDMLNARRMENVSLQRKLIEREQTEKPVLNISEGITADTLVQIDDQEHLLKAPISGEIQVTLDDQSKIEVTRSDSTNSA